MTDPADLNAQLESLFAAYARRLVAFARTMTTDASADDAVQEAFLRVLLYGRKSSRPIDLGYLLVTVRNEVRRQQRREWGGETRDGKRREATAVSKDARAGGIARDASERAVQACFEALRQPLKEALRLTAVNGLSGSDAARALGVSASALERQRRLAVRTVQGAAAAWLGAKSQPTQATGAA